VSVHCLCSFPQCCNHLSVLLTAVLLSSVCAPYRSAVIMSVHGLCFLPQCCYHLSVHGLCSLPQCCYHLSVHCLCSLPQCCYHLSVNAAPQPAANGRSRTGCTFSQSAVVDPPGAASCSVTHRHATRQVCGKPIYTVIQHLDTRNRTATDRQYIMLIMLYLFKCYFRQMTACDWPPFEHQYVPLRIAVALHVIGMCCSVLFA
jgi:hypothetical protein